MIFMIFKKIIYTVAILISVFTTVYSQEIDPRFEKANVAYTGGNYIETIDLYSQILNEGYIAPELFYNLANAYYKNNQPAKAILYYERALKLKSEDEDIKFNLQMANLKIVDKMDAMPRLFFENWWDDLKNFFSMDAWAWLGVITLLFSLSLFILFLVSDISFFKKTGFFLSILFLLVSLSSFVFAQKHYRLIHNEAQAIVMAPTVVVKSSPAESGTELFVIHEGLKVSITENVGDWYQIKLPNGNQGWLKLNTVEII
jgi:tetratricopeptide (TPR) repeat protein